MSLLKKREIKVVLLFNAMFLIFLLSWTPLVVINLLITVKSAALRLITREWREFFCVFRFISSIINPTMYTLFKADIRMTFREDLRRVSTRLNTSLEGKKSEGDRLLITALADKNTTLTKQKMGCSDEL